MRRVLVLTWALGTATGVLLGLFGVELVSSRFSTAGVSPLSRPEVLRALQAARSSPPAGVALPAPSNSGTAPSPSSVDAGPARPSAGSASSSAPASPASTRPGATTETFREAGVPSTTSTAPPPEPSTTTTTAAPADDGQIKPKSDSKGPDKSDRPSTSTSSSPTTATTSKKTTTTTTPPAPPSRPGQPPQQQAATQTISSVGGVVAVRYSGGKVELKWARPNAGYQVYVRSNGPDQVIVYFYNRNHVSQVVAYYNGPTPAADVQEYSGSSQSGKH